MTRTELRLTLQAIAERVNVLRPNNLEHVTKELQKLNWFQRYGDEAQICALCSAQDTHTDRCPAALLEAPLEARTR